MNYRPFKLLKYIGLIGLVFIVLFVLSKAVFAENDKKEKTTLTIINQISNASLRITETLAGHVTNANSFSSSTFSSSFSTARSPIVLNWPIAAFDNHSISFFEISAQREINRQEEFIKAGSTCKTENIQAHIPKIQANKQITITVTRGIEIQDSESVPITVCQFQST